MTYSKEWRLIPLQCGSPAENMAIDEAILEGCRKKITPNTLRFYTWTPSTASIGRNQIIKDEIDLEYAKNNNIAVVRRISGGGAVFHDKDGEITYCIVSTDLTQEDVDSTYILLSEGIKRGLERIGIEASHGKIHCPSLFVQGRKISGNAQARRGKATLQHGTILLDYDPDLMYKVLRVPPGKTHTGIVRSVFQHVTTISREKGKKIELEKVYKALIEGFEEALNTKFKIGELSNWEREKVKELETKRYKNQQWNFKK